MYYQFCVRYHQKISEVVELRSQGITYSEITGIAEKRDISARLTHLEDSCQRRKGYLMI